MAQLRCLLGRVCHQGAFQGHPIIKPMIGMWWGPVSSSSSSCSYIHESPRSSPKDSEGSGPFFCGTSFYKGATKDDWIITLARFAVRTHNQNENKKLEFVRVVGASHTMASSILYHITFEIVDAKKYKIYHAVVWMQLLKNVMELLVWNPVDDRLSAVGVKRGDLKLHEAVMMYMNQRKGHRFWI